MKVVSRSTGGLAQELEVRTHKLVVDEPEDKGGANTGPSPTELLALSLASCTAITLEMYAGRKGWDLGAVEVEVEYDRDERERKRYEVLVKVPASLSEEQRERLRMIAAKCPVHLTLTGEVEITDRIVAG